MTEPINRRILVIDDNRAIHDDFNKILGPASAQDHSIISAFENSLFGGAAPLPEIEPFELVSAFQGQDALELVRRARDSGHPFALAFVDVRMPPDGMASKPPPPSGISTPTSRSSSAPPTPTTHGTP